jgi:periplasmic protein TonB
VIVLPDWLRRRTPALVLMAMVALACLPYVASASVAPIAPTASGPTTDAAPAAARAGRGSKGPLVAISTPPPEFPAGARRQGKSGSVLVSYTVGVDGRVGNIRILESDPRGVFDHVVETTLARWRYQPPSAPREVVHTFYFDQ